MSDKKEEREARAVAIARFNKLSKALRKNIDREFFVRTVTSQLLNEQALPNSEPAQQQE